MPTDFALGWIANQVAGLSPQSVITVTPAAQSEIGHLSPLAKAASVLGENIDAALLAHILNMDVAQLRPLLTEWEMRGGVIRVKDHYRFTEPHLRITAYANVATPARQVLHLRAADALSRHAASFQPVPADEIAHHYQAAGQSRSAFGWWQTAADCAVKDGSPEAAIGHLERAIALCAAERPAVPPEDELAVLRVLGPLLAQIKGSGSREVAAIYARCLEIADGLQNTGSPAAFDVLWGLNACILVHGRIATARGLSKRLTRAAGNDTQMLMATRLQGLASLLAGDIASALVDFRSVKQLYEKGDHAGLRFRYASDQGAVARAHQAWAEAIAGEASASEHSSNEALKQAERLQHPHTSAHVMCVLAARAQTLAQRNTAGPLANAGRTIARQHKFPYWEAWADIILGWHDGQRIPEIGAARIDRAIHAYRCTGAGQALPYAHLLRAGVALATGDHTTVITAADEGLALSKASGVFLFDAEILLIKSQAMEPGPGRQALVARAASIAHAQGARLFEARAVAIRDGRGARWPA